REERLDAEQVLAELLQEVGRSQEAAELFARLRADPGFLGAPCRLGTLLTNWGWSRLIAREGGEEAEDPTPILTEAQALFDGNGCARPERRLNARLNPALAYEQSSRWPEARQTLLQAGPLLSQASLRQRLWLQDLEGRAAIAEGHPVRALSLYA